MTIILTSALYWESQAESVDCLKYKNSYVKEKFRPWESSLNSWL